MTVDRISYSKIIPIGAYCNERIGLEASINDGDNVETSMQKLKDLVNSLASNPNQVVESGNGDILVERPTDRVEAIIYDLNSCTDKKILETYKIIAKNYPKIQEAYDKKMGEFI
jgi:sulfur carrier protein ThiS